VARCHNRPFSVGALTFANARALRQDHGSAIADHAFRCAVDTVVESLRDSDFMGVDGSHAIFIGFPETTEAEAREILDGLATRVAQTAGLPIVLALAAAQGEHAGELLPQDALT
jgi:GGDEF domain-containing protein